MASENETVADVVKEMRNPTTQEWEKPDELLLSLTDARAVVARYADRIEATHRREAAELRECLKEAVASEYGRCHSRWACCLCSKDCKVKRWRKELKGAKDVGKCWVVDATAALAKASGEGEVAK